MSIGLTNKDAKAEIERHPATTEEKTEKSVQCNLKSYKPICASYSSIHFALFLQ